MRELVPARIDSTNPFMVGQSGSNQAFLMAALRFFGLVEEKKPTDKLRSLVKAEGDERKSIWRSIFEAAYAPIIGDLDLTTATAGMLHEKFREQGLSGETVNKCFSFFVAGADDAGIAMAKHLKPGEKRGSGAPRRPRRPRANPVVASGQNFAPDVLAVKPDMRQLLLAKFPEFDPAWSDELKMKWFGGYERLLKSATDPDEAPQ
jgi:hypothetical protein